MLISLGPEYLLKLSTRKLDKVQEDRLIHARSVCSDRINLRRFLTSAELIQESDKHLSCCSCHSQSIRLLGPQNITTVDTSLIMELLQKYD